MADKLLANENQALLHPTSQQPLHSSTGGALIWPTAIQGTCQSQLGSCLPQAPCTRWKSRGSGQCCYQYIDGSFLLLILQGESPETPNLTCSLIKPLQQGSQTVSLWKWKWRPWNFKLIWIWKTKLPRLLSQCDPLPFKPYLSLSHKLGK